MTITVLLCLICLQPYTSAHVAKPTVINSTGEYYITDGTTNFDNQEIQCNSSISNCFVICRDWGCQQTNITAPNNDNSSLYIQCLDDSSCERGRVIGSKNHNSSLYLECLFSYSCPEYVNTMHSNQSSIICGGSNSITIDSTANRNNISYLSISLRYQYWNRLIIRTSNVTMLNLHVYNRANAVLLYQSLWTNFTTITCENADACLGLDIAIPASSHYHFNANVVVNGQNIDTFGYKYLTIYCINTTTVDVSNQWQWDAIDCTNDTDFPIFDVAVPSESSGNSVYYISDDAYWYRYQRIILDEKGSNINDYYIECSHDHSCSLTFIEFKANIDSNCAISCTGDYSCTKYTIYSMPTNNSNISMMCQGNHVCTIYHPGYAEYWWDVAQSSIIAFSGNELTFVLDDSLSSAMLGDYVNISASDGQSLYIYLKSVYGNVIYVNAKNAKVLHLELDERHPGDDWSIGTYIHSPISEQSIFDLVCVNYGCYMLSLWLPNGTGLNHVNVSFTGDCDQCHLLNDTHGQHTTECIRYWRLLCPNQTYNPDFLWPSHVEPFRCYEGDIYYDQCKVCGDDGAKNIENAFTEYWVGFECPVDKTLFIVLISGGSVLFVLLVLMIVRYKFCKKKDQGADSAEYQPINETHEKA